MVLLPLIDLIILICIIICCCLNLLSSKKLFKTSFLLEIHNQHQYQQCLAESLRSTVEKMTCVKCYSNFLQQNRTILQDTDPYTKLHTRFFSQNLSSARPSISPSEDLRKYSTVSCENLPTAQNYNARLRASYPCQPTRSLLSDKAISSQHDFTTEQRLDHGRNSANDLFLQTTLAKLKHKHSFCHLCYGLLLIFLLKYVLLTFPQHYIQMNFHLKQFFEYILKYSSTNYHQHSTNEYRTTIIRLLYLCARFADCLLLTTLPNFIQNYFPCWFHFNSKIFREENQIQRASHQILVKNTELSTNEPLTNDDAAVSNDLNHRQNSSRRHNRRYRLRFQFVPIWSNSKRSTFIRQKC